MKRVLYMTIAALTALGWLCAGCIKLPGPPPPPPIAPVELTFSFKNAAPARQSSRVAKLSYAVATPSGVCPMELLDPDNPQGAEVKLALCTIKAKPFVGIPKVTNQKMQECTVHCCYTLCVRDALGVHLGDFEINDWGALVLKGDTVSPEVDVQCASTAEHTMYFYYRNRPGQARTKLILALEYHLDKFYTKLTSVAADGWKYTFWAPDGKLLVHDPTTLAGLQDTLLARAGTEQEGREKFLDDWAKEQDRRNKACSTGGG